MIAFSRSTILFEKDMGADTGHRRSAMCRKQRLRAASRLQCISVLLLADSQNAHAVSAILVRAAQLGRVSRTQAAEAGSRNKPQARERTSCSAPREPSNLPGKAEPMTGHALVMGGPSIARHPPVIARHQAAMAARQTPTRLTWRSDQPVSMSRSTYATAALVGASGGASVVLP